MNRIFRRTWVSPAVAVLFASVAITGLMMFFHVRNHSINFLHEWSGMAFSAAGIIHLLINWKAFLSCIKRPFGVAAVVVFALICLVMIFGYDPETPPSHHDFRHGGSGSEFRQ